MRYRTFISAIVINTFLATGAYAASEGMSATQFVQKASVSNLFEIESGKLAEERAVSAEVKDFAAMMITDHSKAGDELKAAVEETGMDSAAIAKTMDAAHRDKMATLRQKNGEAFDDAYIAMQETAHDEAVRLFSNYSQNGDNEELKAFASKTLPALKKHKNHVETMD